MSRSTEDGAFWEAVFFVVFLSVALLLGLHFFSNGHGGLKSTAGNPVTPHVPIPKPRTQDRPPSQPSTPRSGIPETPNPERYESENDGPGESHRDDFLFPDGSERRFSMERTDDESEIFHHGPASLPGQSGGLGPGQTPGRPLAQPFPPQGPRGLPPGYGPPGPGGISGVGYTRPPPLPLVRQGAANGDGFIGGAPVSAAPYQQTTQVPPLNPPGNPAPAGNPPPNPSDLKAPVNLGGNVGTGGNVTVSH